MNRDARYCGVPYGAQDVDFILSKLYPDKHRGVDIDSRLIPNVEAILFSKYLMYRTVYWHKQVRAATAMVKKALINSLESGNLTGEELYNLDDTSLLTLIKSKNERRNGLNHDLIDAVHEGRIFITAAEISCKNIRSGNNGLWDIRHRAQLEEQAVIMLKYEGLDINVEDLIIDIPEPVSFETGLYVLDEECDFNSSSSAFNAGTVDGFVKTLYTIRLFINQKFKEIIKTFPQTCSILSKVTQKEIK
jgi:HD superfamily phosphohydrolase